MSTWGKTLFTFLVPPNFHNLLITLQITSKRNNKNRGIEVLRNILKIIMHLV